MTPNPIQTTLTCRATFAAVLSSATIGLTGCDQKQSASTTPPQSIPAAANLSKSQVTPTDNILPRVAKQIGDILRKPASTVTADKDLFKDFGADSLDAVEIVMAIEEEFKMSIDDESAVNMRTVSDIVTYIRTHTKP